MAASTTRTAVDNGEQYGYSPDKAPDHWDERITIAADASDEAAVLREGLIVTAVGALRDLGEGAQAATTHAILIRARRLMDVNFAMLREIRGSTDICRRVLDSCEPQHVADLLSPLADRPPRTAES